MIDFPDGSARTGVTRLADLWFPGTARSPRLTAVQRFEPLLMHALQVDPGLSEAFVAAARMAGATENLTPDVVAGWPLELTEAAFYFLSCVYYMTPEARRAVGYPGQVRNPLSEARPDQLVDDELLAPVRALGPTYVPTPTSD